MPVPLDIPSPSAPSVPLHRIRFLDHTPSPITALSFAPLPLPPAQAPTGKGKSKDTFLHPSSVSAADEYGVLVVARDNGDVEIWQWNREEPAGNGNWAMLKVLPPTLTHPTISHMSLIIRDPRGFGSKGYRVPKIEDLRLITAGSDSIEIVERCLLTGRVLHTTPINSAPIWSMSVSPTHELLCVASTAQTLTFFSIPPDSSALAPPPPHLLRCEALPSRTKTVSIAWAPPEVVRDQEAFEEEAWMWRDTYLVTGHSDSSFRKWILPVPVDGSRTGGGRVTLKGRAVLERIQKSGRGGHGKKSGNQKGTIVWGVGVLPDHTIVTADSLGTITFWDSASLAQKQSFQAHKADAMCMTIGPLGRTIFTSGPDQRVSQFTQVPSAADSQWVHSSTKRLHSHDVRCLSIFPPYTPFAPAINPSQAPILASGGWDMSLSLTPAAAPGLDSSKLSNPLGRSGKADRLVFEEAYAKKMAYLGGGRGTGRVAFSRFGRLVVCRKDRGVGIWRVLEDEEGWEKLLDMDLRLRTHITAIAVSADGQWLAVSDLYETKLFRLQIAPSGSLNPHRIRSFLPALHASAELEHLSLHNSGTGSSVLHFTSDSQRLIMGLSHSLSTVIIELPPLGDEDVRVTKCFKPLSSSVSGRTVVPVSGRRKRARRRGKNASEGAEVNGPSKSLVNGDGAPHISGVVNGHAGDRSEEAINGGGATADDDVDMDAEGKSQAGDTPQDEEEGESKSMPGAWISCVATSEDGQWLAISDLAGASAIFNLDTLRLHSVLPTLPVAPCAIAFPPSSPHLLALLAPTCVLQLYHIDQRILLHSSPQLTHLNNVALKRQFTPCQSLAFEPSRKADVRGTKVVIWAHDWLCTAYLDLEAISHGRNGGANHASKALRRKRAREAREALEMASVSSDVPATPSSASGSTTGKVRGGYAGIVGKPSSAANDPEFYKTTGDRFRGVCAVGWLGGEDGEDGTPGAGELCVVERPIGDFVGELPPAFWSGTFGKS